MKNLDLNAYGVVAMPKQEMQKENGGSIISIALYLLEAAGVYLLTDIVGNPKSSSQAFQKGCDSAPTFDTMRNPF